MMQLPPGGMPGQHPAGMPPGQPPAQSPMQPPLTYTSSMGSVGAYSMNGSTATNGGGGGASELTQNVSRLSVAAAPPPLSNIPAAEVKFEIKAEALRDRDVMSKSDPIAVVFEEVRPWTLGSAMAPGMGMGGVGGGGVGGGGGADMAGGGGGANSVAEDHKWREIGRTEGIKNDLNPHFTKHVTVPYRFEELQNIRIGLWDIDSKNPALNMQDFLGDVRTTLGDVVAAGCWKMELSYPRAADNKTITGKKRKLGTVTVIVHEDSKSDKIGVLLGLSATGLDRKDLPFGKSDPYCVITQIKGKSEARAELYRTEVVRKSLKPKWKTVRIQLDAPKGGTKEDVRIEFRVVDRDAHSRDDEIGLVVTTLAELETSPNLMLVNMRNRKKGKRKSSGTLYIQTREALVLPTMINYLQGGLKLHFTVAVDMTMSNGDPRNPASLHYMDPVMRTNQYVKALTAVAQIIEVYTPSDNRLAAYGFGADINQSNSASHCFPLSLGTDPYCVGLQGIFAAYGHALSTIRLSGPTNFTPLLETVMQQSSRRGQSQQNQSYDVLLILTDGVVSDFVRTVDKIIEASHTSGLSIVIIGVGNADFRKMDILDGDDVKLTSSDGRRTVNRDIVQFVPVRASPAAVWPHSLPTMWSIQF